jgi:hypothetical protein
MAPRLSRLASTTAYAMRPSTTRTELTEVRRGTPMGELLRRYWRPIGLATDATDVPRKVRALGAAASIRADIKRAA